MIKLLPLAAVLTAAGLLGAGGIALAGDYNGGDSGGSVTCTVSHSRPLLRALIGGHHDDGRAVIDLNLLTGHNGLTGSDLDRVASVTLLDHHSARVCRRND